MIVPVRIQELGDLGSDLRPWCRITVSCGSTPKESSGAVFVIGAGSVPSTPPAVVRFGPMSQTNTPVAVRVRG